MGGYFIYTFDFLFIFIIKENRMEQNYTGKTLYDIFAEYGEWLVDANLKLIKLTNNENYEEAAILRDEIANVIDFYAEYFAKLGKVNDKEGWATKLNKQNNLIFSELFLKKENF